MPTLSFESLPESMEHQGRKYRPISVVTNPWSDAVVSELACNFLWRYWKWQGVGPFVVWEPIHDAEETTEQPKKLNEPKDTHDFYDIDVRSTCRMGAVLELHFDEDCDFLELNKADVVYLAKQMDLVVYDADAAL